MYEEGRGGLPCDREEARRWFEKASAGDVVWDLLFPDEVRSAESGIERLNRMEAFAGTMRVIDGMIGWRV